MNGNWKWNEPSPQEIPQKAAGMREMMEEAATSGEDLRGKHFVDEHLDLIEGQSLDIAGCVFERCTFGEMDVKRRSFADCIFVKCEWSNARLSNAAFQRVRFVNCRMTGVEF